MRLGTLKIVLYDGETRCQGRPESLRFKRTAPAIDWRRAPHYNHGELGARRKRLFFLVGASRMDPEIGPHLIWRLHEHNFACRDLVLRHRALPLEEVRSECLLGPHVEVQQNSKLVQGRGLRRRNLVHHCSPCLESLRSECRSEFQCLALARDGHRHVQSSLRSPPTFCNRL